MNHARSSPVRIGIIGCGNVLDAYLPQCHKLRQRGLAEIVLAELAGWPVGTGDALPEMLLALAIKRLRLRDTELAAIRTRALAASLPPYLTALAQAIPHK